MYYVTQNTLTQNDIFQLEGPSWVNWLFLHVEECKCCTLLGSQTQNSCLLEL